MDFTERMDKELGRRREHTWLTEEPKHTQEEERARVPVNYLHTTLACRESEAWDCSNPKG
jgi:hypothetical protein